VLSGETWLWDRAAGDWKLKSSSGPPARTGCGLSWDGGGKAILFGGSTNSGSQNDTWLFDLSTNTWSVKGTTTTPPARSNLNLAFDPLRSKVVMVGGGFVTPFTWEFDGNDWQSTSPSPEPPARSFSALAYDSALHSVVLFGGVASGSYLGTLW